MVIVTVIIGPFVSGFSKYNKIRKLNIWHKHWGKKETKLFRVFIEYLRHAQFCDRQNWEDGKKEAWPLPKRNSQFSSSVRMVESYI